MVKQKKIILFSLFLAFLLTAALLIMAIPSEFDEKIKQNATVGLAADEASTVDIVTAEGSTYKLIFSGDSRQSDATLASNLSNLIRKGTGVNLRQTPDTTAESEFEILLGDTNRAVSAELLAKLQEYGEPETMLVWGYMYKDGKLAYTANCDTAFTLGMDDFLALVGEDGTLSVPSDLFFIGTKTVDKYEEEEEDKKEEETLSKLEKLIATNNEFTQAQFGGDYLEMPTNMYNNPWYYPTEGEHPRLFFRESDIATIYDELMNNPELTTLRNKLLSYANVGGFTGIFPEKTGDSGEVNRFSTTVLAQLEAKALMYAFTGDKIYGYEAIIGAKNVMLSLKYTKDLHSDTYHGASQVMLNVAKVYDWCYDLMSEEDKSQIIAGVSNLLAPQYESGMRFPPSGYSAISGHGTGPQFTRDWVTVALAFYDEVPSWWQFVGGRYFQEYVPVIDYCYQGGYASQGTVTYGDSKYFTKGWAAWVIKNATGEFPYEEEEGFHLGAYYFVSHIQPNGLYFQIGDAGRNPNGSPINSGLGVYFISAMLFQDPALAVLAKEYSNNYTYFSYEFTMESTVVDTLIWKALGPDFNEETKDELELIQYLPFPSDTMTARNSWSEDGAAVLMRMGGMTMGNHDHRDHGTFQIYYKGLLTGSQGQYVRYECNSHKYYTKSTIGSNGLLIFNPSFADNSPVWNCSNTSAGHTHSLTTCPISNAKRYFYSGGQDHVEDPIEYNDWISGKYNMAHTYGTDYAYDPIDGSAKWAYNAAELTNAYSSSTVDYVSRDMLTVFTDDPLYPMLFFTYDKMRSVAGGESFKKSFLLHTSKEPQVDAENLTAIVTVGKGRLFMHSVSGAENIEAIGGSGKAYWINGKNCLDTYVKQDAANSIWGRIELTSTGNLSDSFLTAMYVSDATNDKALDITNLANEYIDGVSIKDKIIAFTKGESKNRGTFEFTTDGIGLKEYYIAGLASGTWSVNIDGVTVAHAYTAENSGIITFTAPTGKVTITPGKDVRPLNSDDIIFNTSGGILPDDVQNFYVHDVEYVLPVLESTETREFAGWYLSLDSFERVYTIPAGTRGKVTLYAKWYTGYALDFEQSDIHFAEQNKKSAPLGFWGKNKTGIKFDTVEEENGNKYLRWIAGMKDGRFCIESSMSDFLADRTAITFKVDIALDGDNPAIRSSFRLRGTGTYSTVFRISEDGIVTTESENPKIITTLTKEFQTITACVDFKNSMVYILDENNDVICSDTLYIPASVTADNPNATGIDVIPKLSHIFDWYANNCAEDNGRALRIDNIKITSGMPEINNNFINYVTDGGTLPEDAPRRFNTDGTETPLPTPTKDGYKFCGWYTTPGFADGTETSAVPQGYEGAYDVYAKWELIVLDKVLIDEDYSSVEIDHSESSAEHGGIVYNGDGVRYSSYKTEADENGNKYLIFNPGVKAAKITVDNDTDNISTYLGTAISYTVTLGKNGTKTLPELEFKVIGEHTVTGDVSAVNSCIYLGRLNKGGTFTIGDSDTVVATVGEEALTLRITLSFSAQLIIAYDENGTALGSAPLPAIPEETGATWWREWMACFRSNLLTVERINGTNAKRNESVKIYGIKVETGNVFEKTE